MLSTMWICKKCREKAQIYYKNGLEYISCDNSKCDNFYFLRTEKDSDFLNFFIEKDYGMIKIMPDQYIKVKEMIKNLSRSHKS